MNTKSDQTLIRVVCILLQSIGHCVVADSDDGPPLCEEINVLVDNLIKGIEPEELLVRVGSALKGFEDYNRRSAQRQSLQTAELKNILRMVTSTVAGISATGDANVSILGEIEKQVALVSELSDIRVIKVKLVDCLTQICREAERQKSQTAETVERLTRELAQVTELSASSSGGKGRDPITGLSLRREAEAALANWQPLSHAYVALLVFDNLQAMNQRFGRDAGDELFAAFASMIQQRLKPVDRLFRWGGPAIVALLPRQESLQQVRSEIARVMGNKAEHLIKNRDILIPLAGRWTLFPLMAVPQLMYQKLDTFAATPTSVR